MSMSRTTLALLFEVVFQEWSYELLYAQYRAAPNHPGSPSILDLFIPWTEVRDAERALRAHIREQGLTA